MLAECVCQSLHGEPDKSLDLNLLSQIPNQRIYRCGYCHSFLAYTEDVREWEVLLQADLETEIKTLYEPEVVQRAAT